MILQVSNSVSPGHPYDLLDCSVSSQFLVELVTKTFGDEV